MKDFYGLLMGLEGENGGRVGLDFLVLGGYSRVEERENRPRENP